MVQQWLTIAKAEFLMLSARYRKNRKRYVFTIFLLLLIWVLFISHIAVPGILNIMLPDYGSLLLTSLPGLSRIAIMILWIMILVNPISNALREIRIAQWETLLSANIRTRDIIVGKFLGSLPNQIILVMILAPIFVAPVVYVFQVALVGELAIYGVILLTVFSATWVSVVVASALQAKLGESKRGEEMAKLIASVMSLIVIIPLMGLMYMTESMALFMSTDANFILPSTWGADLISWLTLNYRGIDLSSTILETFNRILQIAPSILCILLASLSILSIGVGLAVSNMIYTYNLGVRSERVVTVGEENLVLRVVRKLYRNSPTGALVATVLKDFYRKPRNIMTISVALTASIMPLISIPFMGGDQIPDLLALMVFLTMILMTMMYPIIGAGILGVSTFLDNEKQLWIILAAPHGGRKFMKSKVIGLLLSTIPMAVIPSVLIGLLVATSILSIVLLLLYALLLFLGSIMIGTGLSALNPAYSDTLSSTNKLNGIAALMIALIAAIIPPVILIDTIEAFTGLLLGFGLLTTLPLIAIGVFFYWVGIRNLEKSRK